MPSTTQTAPRTFHGPTGAGVPPLAGLTGVHRVAAEPDRELEVERYDTADRRLAAAGIALAVRRDDQPARWELRTPEGEALRLPADDGPAGGRLAVPAEIDALVRAVVRGRPVRPVARVRTVRTEHRLHDDAGATAARIVHDAVSLSTFGRSTDVTAWTEITVDASDELGAELGRRSVDSGWTAGANSAESALDRVLAPQRRRRTRLEKGTAGAALDAYLGEQVDRIAAEDLRFRRHEPDAVHQLRVAARRLRSALQGYRALLDRDRTDALAAELRWLGAALAPARDAEVVHERVDSALRELPVELRLGDASGVATRYLARIEAEATAAAQQTLDSDRYTALRDQLDQLLAHPPLQARPAGKKAATALLRHVEKAERRLEKRITIATDPQLRPERRVAAVHAARKAGKRLRYVTEVARPAVGKPAKRYAKAARTLQRGLGEHQDAVVAQGTLRALGALAHTEGENGFAFGVLHGRDTALAARIEGRLPAMWAEFRGGKERRKLHKAARS